MSREQVETYRVYFAGASLAFGLPFLVFEVIGLFTGGDASVLQALSALFVVLHLVGGILGGYIVAASLPGEGFKAATITAALAYILQQLVYYVFYRGMALGDPFIFGGLVAGSIVGYKIAQTRWKSKEEA